MDNTYVKVYRSLLDHDTLSNDNTALIVFVKLLLKVNRHTGSLTTGRFKLAAMTNLKPSTCWDALRRLQTDSIVTLKPTGQSTTIYICNWHEYQTRDRQQTDSKPTANRVETDTITRTKKEKKNISNAEVTVELPEQLQRVHLLSCELFGKNANQYQLTDKRKKKLKARLKDTGEERMAIALKTLADSPFHRGDNDRGWEADPDWLFNSFEKTEEWANKGQSVTAGANTKLSELEF